MLSAFGAWLGRGHLGASIAVLIVVVAVPECFLMSCSPLKPPPRVAANGAHTIVEIDTLPNQCETLMRRPIVGKVVVSFCW